VTNWLSLQTTREFAEVVWRVNIYIYIYREYDHNSPDLSSIYLKNKQSTVTAIPEVE
jgi:hypothetical protein